MKSVNDKDATPAFVRDGKTYRRHLPALQPYSEDPVPDGAIVCARCPLYCPAGRAGFHGIPPEWLPERLKKLRETLLDTGLPGHDPNWPAVFATFLRGVGYCAAHAPVPGEVGGAGLTHRSWRCGSIFTKSVD